LENSLKKLQPFRVNHQNEPLELFLFFLVDQNINRGGRGGEDVILCKVVTFFFLNRNPVFFMTIPFFQLIETTGELAV